VHFGISPQTFYRWGKDKLVILLKEQGFEVSPSMVGRPIGSALTISQLREGRGNGLMG